MSKHQQILSEASTTAFDVPKGKGSPGACCNRDCSQGRECPARRFERNGQDIQAPSWFDIGLACTVEIALVGAGIVFTAYIFDAWELMKVVFGS